MRATLHLRFPGIRNVLLRHFFRIEDHRDRERIDHELRDVCMGALAMFCFQDPSLLQFQKRTKASTLAANLKNVWGIKSVPSDSQMRTVMDEIDPEVFEGLFKTFFRLLQRGKHLEQYRVLGKYYLCVVDGGEYFSSYHIGCPFCLRRKVKKQRGDALQFSHQIVQAAVVHSKRSQVIPLCPEQVRNTDGTEKQDCETVYEWVGDVPLNGNKDAPLINYFEYWMIDGEKTVYHNSWVTDLPLDDECIEEMVRIGRSRWMIENEVFNTVKNHGYHIEHNYGHGVKNLSMNFFLLNLLAFFLHQIFELTDRTYQWLRKNLGSKRNLWDHLRVYCHAIVFPDWDDLLGRIALDYGYS